MVRTRVALPPDLYERLRELASARGLTMADLIREAVEGLLGDSERQASWDAATAALGAFSSDSHDVSVDHDAYLDEAFAT